MEYFSFVNLFLLFLFIIISLFFILINSTLLYYINISFDDTLVEFISTLFSLLFLIVIISPALIILLDFDLTIVPSYIIYSLGLQWAWQFNLNFLPIDTGYDSYVDHYVISTINRKIDKAASIPKEIKSIKNRLSIIHNKNNTLNYPLNFNQYKVGNISITYLFEISQYILLPMYSFIRLYVYSFDVIHTLGFYAWGIKIDAIPGRVNLATTLRLLWKGEYRGKCFELCGQGHLSMAICSILYPLINPLLLSYVIYYLYLTLFYFIIHYT